MLKNLHESGANADEERESPSAQIHQLDSENKYLTRQVQIMTGIIKKQNQQIKIHDSSNIQLINKRMGNNLLIGGLKKLKMKTVIM